MFFETIKIQDGIIKNLQYHNDRMNKTRKDIFSIKIPLDLKHHIRPIFNKTIKCRVLYQKEILSISYASYKPRSIYSFKIVIEDNILYKYKSNNRSTIDSLFAKKGDNDEILIIKNGLLTDTSISNVAILKDNVWITPKMPLLNGAFRESLLQEKKIITSDITTKELLKADKIALINSMIGFYVISDFKIRT